MSYHVWFGDWRDEAPVAPNGDYHWNGKQYVLVPISHKYPDHYREALEYPVKFDSRFTCPLCGELHDENTWQDECEYHRGSERGSEPEAPSHYARFGSRILDLCALLPFFEGSVVKYVCRHKEKGGREDLLKAREYVDLLIEQYKERS